MNDIEWTQIGLWCLVVVLFIGLIRVLFNKPKNMGDFFMDILLIDLLIDLIEVVVEGID